MAGQVPTEVVTDSAYVVRALKLAARGALEASLPKAANCDLLILLQDAWFPLVRVRKVKSHLDPCSCTCPAQQWDALGNSLADVACKQALEADLSVVREMIDSAFGQLQQQKTQLAVVYKYLVELHGLSNRQLNGTNFSQVQEDDQTVPVLSVDAPVVQRWLRARTQHAPSQALPTPDPRVFYSSSWGVPFAWRVWTWLQTLQWCEDSEADFPAVTTLEVLCNFVVITAALPPTAIQHPRGGVDYEDFTTPTSRMTPVALRTWLQSLTTATKQLARLTSTVLLPPTATTKVCVLQALGEIHPRAGFRTPCRMQQSEETVTLLLAVLHRPGTQVFRSYVEEHQQRLLVPPDALRHAPLLAPHARKAVRKSGQ